MPARSEIDDKFKWAVSDLYSSDEAWEKDCLLYTSPSPRDA